MLSENKCDNIACEVISVLWGRFCNFPGLTTENRNAPFHEAFLNAFTPKLHGIDLHQLINLSSWIQGLNTTLGQTFFENVAHILSGGEKREFTQNKNNSMQISAQQQVIINNIVTELKNNNRSPNLDQENQLIFEIDNVKPSSLIASLDFTVDNYFETDDEIEAIELKTVRPNAGQMQGEKQKILFAKASFFIKNPNKKIKYYFAFPFDPWSDSQTGYDKDNFLSKIIEGKKFLDPNEVLLADELWSHLSGDIGTMQEILNIINQIATPEFEEKYHFIQDPVNYSKDPTKYLRIIHAWSLHRENFLLSNFEKIKKIVSVDQRASRSINNFVFDQHGNYNERRFNNLVSLMDQQTTL